MTPFNIIGAITGAISGATGGKISLEKAVQAATKEASLRLDVPITPTQAKPVAEAIAENMPSPKAMEPLWPQLLRSGLMVFGGYLAGQGYLERADSEALVTAALLVGPVLWRVVTTWVARWRAKA